LVEVPRRLRLRPVVAATSDAVPVIVVSGGILTAAAICARAAAVAGDAPSAGAKYPFGRLRPRSRWTPT
jgi:hypothetical protein